MADAETLKQLVLGRKDVQDLSDTETELPPELMTVNMGPSHPAMHGTVRIVLTVDGERDRQGATSSPATCTAASRRNRSTRRTRRSSRTPTASTTSRR